MWSSIAPQSRIDITDFETKFPGHNMLNLTVSYPLGDSGNARVSLRGRNPLEGRGSNPTSLLASGVPPPGRNYTAGVRYGF